MRAGQLTGALGRFLLLAGTVILLFVAYQLWGTGIAESHSQSVLRSQLDHELKRADRGSPESSSTTVPAGTGPAPTTTAAPAPGQPVGLIQIPKIGVDKVIVEGTDTSDLRQGPGHYRGTPLPGQAGNAAIAGHRTTYGAPFYNLNELGPGDPVTVTTTQGVFTYKVVRSMVILPSDTAILAASTTPELTLTTCTPRFSASNRLAVQATLVSSRLTAPPGGTTTATTVPGGQVAAEADGLGGGQGNWSPALWWGIGVLAAGTAVWLVARRRRSPVRWLVYGAGTAGVLVVLFFFFGALSPLLPASF